MPAGFDGIVAKLLTKDKAERYQRATDVERDLEELGAAGPGSGVGGGCERDICGCERGASGLRRRRRVAGASWLGHARLWWCWRRSDLRRGDCGLDRNRSPRSL